MARIKTLEGTDYQAVCGVEYLSTAYPKGLPYYCMREPGHKGVHACRPGAEMRVSKK